MGKAIQWVSGEEHLRQQEQQVQRPWGGSSSSVTDQPEGQHAGVKSAWPELWTMQSEDDGGPGEPWASFSSYSEKDFEQRVT